MKTSLITALLILLTMPLFAQKGGSRTKYVDVSISQPNVMECYNTSVTNREGNGDWLNIYPNPNYGQFSMDIKQLMPGNDLVIDIISTNGNRIYKTTEYPSDNQLLLKLNLGSLPKGVYFIHIQHNQKRASKKLVII
jgi:hypothetical protein